MKQTVDNRLRCIRGRHNAVLKQLRHAFHSNELTASGACAIEGVRLVEEAIRSGLRLEAVFFSESAETRAERLLPQIGAQVETLLVPDKLLSDIVPSETPQGVAALVRMKRFSLSDVMRLAPSGMVLGVAGVQDPGNLGTILRSAEAFGASGVLVGEGTVSPFNSKVVRASAGSIFRLPVVEVKLGQAIEELRGAGLRLLATSPHKGTPLDEENLTEPAVVLVGSEGAGIPRNLMSQVDKVIAIPHAAHVESLNAGIAASIFLYEAARQRNQRSPASQARASSNEAS